VSRFEVLNYQHINIFFVDKYKGTTDQR